MNSKLSLVALALFATLVIVQSAHHNPHIRLRFTVSGRGLKDGDHHGVSPYVKVYSTDSDNDSEIKFGESETLLHTVNPDWSDVFSFDFNPLKDPRWHLVVKDDGLLKVVEGEAWVSVSDYVDHDEYLQVNLSKKGYLILKKA